MPLYSLDIAPSNIGAVEPSLTFSLSSNSVGLKSTFNVLLRLQQVNWQRTETYFLSAFPQCSRYVINFTNPKSSVFIGIELESPMANTRDISVPIT